MINNELTLALFMAWAATVAVWIYDHMLIVAVYRGTKKQNEELQKEITDTLKKVHKAHNEQAQTLIGLGKKLEDVSNKVEFRNMVSPLGGKK